MLWVELRYLLFLGATLAMGVAVVVFLAMSRATGAAWSVALIVMTLATLAVRAWLRSLDGERRPRIAPSIAQGIGLILGAGGALLQLLSKAQGMSADGVALVVGALALAILVFLVLRRGRSVS
jgi:hypothetical protein